MATIDVQVPINTMLADLDESLKTLLKRELDRHGFDGVEIVFDAPDKEWAASLSSPAVNLFLYDIREAKELRPIDWEERRTRRGGTFDLRPPLRIDASYAGDRLDARRRRTSTGCSRRRWRCSTPTRRCRTTCSRASLANGSQRYPLKTRTAQERHEDASDFWTAVGGQYKASFNYVVTLSCEPGVSLERGPEVRTATTRLFDRDARAATLLELHRSGGVVVDADGKAVRERLGAPVETGQLAVTDAEGRFRFDRLQRRHLHGAGPRPGRRGGEGQADDPRPGRRDRARRSPRPQPQPSG